LMDLHHQPQFPLSLLSALLPPRPIKGAQAHPIPPHSHSFHYFDPSTARAPSQRGCLVATASIRRWPNSESPPLSCARGENRLAPLSISKLSWWVPLPEPPKSVSSGKLGLHRRPESMVDSWTAFSFAVHVPCTQSTTFFNSTRIRKSC
jgi:hypothetical protein